VLYWTKEPPLGAIVIDEIAVTLDHKFANNSNPHWLLVPELFSDTDSAEADLTPDEV
jgi:hypothetical protein